MPAARSLARVALALPLLVAAPAPVAAAGPGNAAAPAAAAGPAAAAAPAAAPAAAATRSSLTAAQERVVLRLVDDICGDTWCEGDHAFRFRSFACHPRRGCVLRVQLATWSQEPLHWHDRCARVRGFPRFSDMVVTAADGERSLQPAFYDAVSRAVHTMTASVP